MKWLFLFSSMLFSAVAFGQINHVASDTVASAERTVSDQDGNEYPVKMMRDGKKWLARNLAIVVDSSFCYDFQQRNCDRHGRLYTWEGAKEGCLQLGNGEWRLPTREEWLEMIRKTTAHHNESKEQPFTAYQLMVEGGESRLGISLSGNRYVDHTFYLLNQSGFYWSASVTSQGYANHFIFMNLDQSMTSLSLEPSGLAYSVRCIKD